MNFIRVIAIAVFGLTGTQAHATTYALTDFANDQGYTATGTITTDGALGYIAGTDITSWSITVSGPYALYTLTPSNSGIGLGGSTSNLLFATASSITYTAPLGNQPPSTFYVDEFEIAYNGDAARLIVIGDAWHNCGNTLCYAVIAGLNYQNPITGNPAGVFNFYAGPVVVAGTVPEPSTWAMMLIGFAGLGFVAYRRSQGTSHCCA